MPVQVWAVARAGTHLYGRLSVGVDLAGSVGVDLAGSQAEREQSDVRALIDAVEASPFACSALDDDRRFLQISEAGLKTLAPLSREQVIGRSLYDLIPPGKLEEPEGSFERAISEGCSFSAIRMTLDDGSEIELNRVIMGNVVPGVHVALALDLPAADEGEGDRAGPRIAVYSPDELTALNTRGALSQLGVGHVIAWCTEPGQLPAMVLGHRPDVTIVTTSTFALPSAGPQEVQLVEAVRALLEFAEQNHIETGVLVINHLDRPDVAKEVMALGALGVIGATDSPESLKRAVELVAEGSPYISPALATKVVGASNDGTSAMTAREIEILHLLALGYTNQQVAEELILSVRTVENYRASISRKIDSSDRRDLVKFAIEHQINP